MINAEPHRLIPTASPTGDVPALMPDDKHPLHVAYARAFGLRTWVETGTHEGHSTETMLASGLIDRAYTCDPGATFASSCVQKFRGDPRVTYLVESSVTALPRWLAELEVPALFWLDAHAGDIHGGRELFPLREELTALQAWGRRCPGAFAESVVLVDDARFFGHGHYPTLVEVFVALAGLPVCECRDDIVRAHGVEP